MTFQCKSERKLNFLKVCPFIKKKLLPHCLSRIIIISQNTNRALPLLGPIKSYKINHSKLCGTSHNYIKTEKKNLYSLVWQKGSQVGNDIIPDTQFQHLNKNLYSMIHKSVWGLWHTRGTKSGLQVCSASPNYLGSLDAMFSFLLGLLFYTKSSEVK